MGRSITPKYRVELAGNIRVTPMAWQRSYGRPTAANLAKMVQGYNDSYRPGGVNAHISEGMDVPARHDAARIVRQADDVVMAEWKADPEEVSS